MVKEKLKLIAQEIKFEAWRLLGISITPYEIAFRSKTDPVLIRRGDRYMEVKYDRYTGNKCGAKPSELNIDQAIAYRNDNKKNDLPAIFVPI